MSLRVREATPGDVEALYAIQRDASRAAFGDIFPADRYPFPDDDVRERWRRSVADPKRRVLVAERGARPVGMVAFEPGWLSALYVAPDSWNGGVGSRLHDEAVAALAALGPEARLWVLEDNRLARSFYERRGWRLDGHERRVPFPPHPLDVGYTRPLR